MPDMDTVGDVRTAEDVVALHLGQPVAARIDYLGAGTHRTVYVDRVTRTVYKVGLDAANRREYRVLTESRAAGEPWAPPVALYEVRVDGEYGPLECTVVAMPYLPEDGSIEHAGVVLPGAGDLNPANAVAHGGRLWLIDAGGL